MGRSDIGIFCQTLFGSAGAFEKTAGAPPFSDWATGEELRSFIQKLNAADRKKHAYVLVNALGAGEYFGSNINADFFPWNALAHEGDDYGYKTFQTANAFQHHKNKDHLRAFGKPVLSVLNHPMKRVELIIQLDREKAKLEQADGIITRIDAGEFPDVSMGCRVPYDICSICGHKSKTKLDYCEHMAPKPEQRDVYGPNKILKDGRKIYVINTLPKFFDISFVFIGADKTAKAMAKLASKGNMVCLGEICAIPRPSAEVAEMVSASLSQDSTEKVASANCDCGGPCCESDTEKLATAFSVKTEKTSAYAKLSEIIKNIPTNSFSTKTLPALESEEKDLPNELIERMAKERIGGALSTATMLGIVLKPREFQRTILLRMGEGGLADELDSKGLTFRTVSEVDSSIQIEKDDYVDDLAEALISVLRDRTAFGEPFRTRLAKVGMVVKKSLPTPASVDHSLLDKISAAYNGYRKCLLTKLSQAVEVVNSDPKLREVILGDGLVNIFIKQASTSPVVSLDSVAYLMGAHLSDRGLLYTTAVAVEVAVNNEWLSEGAHF